VNTFNWVYQGRCWKFGNNISVDGDLMSHDMAVQREIRPEVLKDHVMCGIDTSFAAKVSPGDILVAGKRFAQGNPHIQGLLGLAGLKMGLVVESIPRGSFRNAVNAGLPLLSHCEDVTQLCETGDELRVDFSKGTFENLSRGVRRDYAPLDAQLLHTIALGGWKPMVMERLRDMSMTAPSNFLPQT
jgi:3-isopropylmalate/(R)-2-methylmalate dehydratase small subunit